MDTNIGNSTAERQDRAESRARLLSVAPRMGLNHRAAYYAAHRTMEQDIENCVPLMFAALNHPRAWTLFTTVAWRMPILLPPYVRVWLKRDF